MKKVIVILTCVWFLSENIHAQALVSKPLPPTAQTYAQVDGGPQPMLMRYQRHYWIIPRSEINIPAGMQFDYIGFMYARGVDSIAYGNLKIYLENTADTTNAKSKIWPTAISTMTKVYDGVYDLPIGDTAINVDLQTSTTFTYTGGSIYIAYEFEATSYNRLQEARYLVNTKRDNTVRRMGYSSTGFKDTLMDFLTGWRPQMRFSYANPYTTDMTIISASVKMGHENRLYRATDTLVAVVQNTGTDSLSNIDIILNVTGANAAQDTQVIAGIQAGAYVTLYFPLEMNDNGRQMLSVSVPSDMDSYRNKVNIYRTVSCDTLGYADNTVPYNLSGLYGITLARYQAPAVPIRVKGVAVELSNDTYSVGQKIYGVLMKRAGGIIKKSDEVTLTAGDLGKKMSFDFDTTFVLPADSFIMVGIAQPTLTSYKPIAVKYPELTSERFFVAGLNGAAVSRYDSMGTFAIHAIIEADPQFAAYTDTVCPEKTAVYAATGFSSYEFSVNGSSAQNSAADSFAFATEGNQQITFSAMLNGCTAASADTLEVWVKAKAELDLGNDTAFCKGKSLILDAGTGWNSQVWTTSETSQTISVSQSGTYGVTLINADGCDAHDEIKISVNDLPQVNLGNDTAICEGSDIMLDAGTAASWLWNTAETGQTIEVSDPGSYIVVVTDINGCQGTDTIHIDTHALPAVDLGSEVVFCEGGSAELDAGPGFVEYLWSNSETTQTVEVSESGLFGVLVMDANGCIGGDTIFVAEYPLPQVNLGKDTMLCSDTIWLDAGPDFPYYRWSDGYQGQLYGVITEGTYSVTVENIYGCFAADTIEVLECITTGYGKVNAGQIRVYPNPATSATIVELPEAVQGDITLMTLEGRILTVELMQGNSHRLDMSALPKGVYLVRIVSDESVLVTRVVKE